jgi:hypothetical protein
MFRQIILQIVALAPITLSEIGMPITYFKRQNEQKFIFKRLLLTFVLCLLASTDLYAAEILHKIIGRWQVIKVQINSSASRRTGYRFNDPRLLGRFFIFSHQKVTNDTPEASNCIGPKMLMKSTNVVNLIGGSMSGYGYPARRSKPEDYGIETKSTGMVELISISCGARIWESGLGADDGPNGAWIFFSPKGTLIVRWYDETILTLQKLNANVEPDPSFSCSAAKLLAERVICRSVELASFDRSVADTYEQLKIQNRPNASKIKELIESQQQSIRRRNDCKSNEICIKKLLENRLAELVSSNQN